MSARFLKWFKSMESKIFILFFTSINTFHFLAKNQNRWIKIYSSLPVVAIPLSVFFATSSSSFARFFFHSSLLILPVSRWEFHLTFLLTLFFLISSHSSYLLRQIPAPPSSSSSSLSIASHVYVCSLFLSQSPSDKLNPSRLVVIDENTKEIVLEDWFLIDSQWLHHHQIKFIMWNIWLHFQQVRHPIPNRQHPK